MIPNSNENTSTPVTARPQRRRDWRWLVFASFLASTACLDERCGITSPTGTGSHDESTLNLAVKVSLGQAFIQPEVRIVVNGVSTSFSPLLDDRKRDIVLENLPGGSARNIPVLVYVRDLASLQFVHSGSCSWDGKVGIFDPEIFVEPRSGGYSVECYNWQ